VGQFILGQAHFVVRIPQQGRIGSLNASVAAGIALQALALPEGPGGCGRCRSHQDRPMAEAAAIRPPDTGQQVLGE
jgi:hypothetical protein